MIRKISAFYVCLFLYVLTFGLRSLKAQEKHLDKFVKNRVDSILSNGNSILQKADRHIDSIPSGALNYINTLSIDNMWQSYSEKAERSLDSLTFLKNLNPNFYMENEGLYLNSPTQGMKPRWQNITTIGLELQVAGIPLDFQLSGQYNSITGYQFGNSNLFQLQMASLDPRERLSILAGNIDEAKFRKLFTHMSNQGKQIYKQQLAAVEELLPGKEDLQIREFLQEHGGIGELLSKSEAEFNRTLQSAKNIAVEKIKQQKELTTREVDSLKTKYFSRYDSLAQTIAGVKEKLKSFGINDKRSQLLHSYINHEINEESLQQGFFQSFMDENESLSKSRTLFDKLKSFKVGNFGQTIPGNILNKDLFLKGMHFSFNAGNLPLTLGLGKRSDMVAVKDALFEQSAFSSANLITYLNAQVYRFSGVKGKISMSNSSSQSGTGDNGGVKSLAASRNNFAISLEQEMQLKKLGQLSVELSRSSNSYGNGSMQVSELNFVRTDALSSFFNTQLDQSLSIGMKHQIELEEVGLSQSVYFNYAGIGYQSTGLNGNINTRMRMGGAIKKSFLQKKLNLNIRGDLRNTPISIEGKDEWRNHQLQTDASYRIGKKSTLRISYNSNSTNRINGTARTAFNSEKYQGGFNTSYKLLGMQTLSHLTVGQQYFGNYGDTEIKGNFFTVNLAQTILFGSNMVMANVFYNREVSEMRMVGDMLNAEMTYQFNVLKHLVLSPGITYLDNKGIARQMGIKNSLQYTGNKHFTVGGSADVRKNFFDPLFPQLYTNCRAEINFSYYLKGNRN